MDAKTLLGIGAIGGAVYLATSKKAQAKVKKTTGLSDKPLSQTIQRAIKDIKQNTHYNNHTLAMVELAKLLKAKGHQKRLEMIEEFNNMDGHLDRRLGDYRNDIWEKLKASAKTKFSPKEFEAIMRAF